MKKKFVEVYLQELLRNTERADVKYLHYFKENGEEVVYITFNDCSHRIVNVTADSELAIIQDVIRVLM